MVLIISESGDCQSFFYLCATAKLIADFAIKKASGQSGQQADMSGTVRLGHPDILDKPPHPPL